MTRYEYKNHAEKLWLWWVGYTVELRGETKSSKPESEMKTQKLNRNPEAQSS